MYVTFDHHIQSTIAINRNGKTIQVCIVPNSDNTFLNSHAINFNWKLQLNSDPTQTMEPVQAKAHH
jgi:hypothetical protein